MRNFTSARYNAPRPVWQLCQRAIAFCLALLMLVAQSWHICEMGGDDCNMPGMSAARQPDCDKGLKCPCEPKELALRRHLETFVALDGDGHVKATRWSQAWFQDPANHVLEGAFDPRQ